MEMEFVEKHHTYSRDPKGPGYNLTRGGDDAPSKNPDVAAKIKATLATPISKAKRSSIQKIAQNVPSYKPKHRAAVIKSHARPGSKLKRSEALEKAFADPSIREAISARMQNTWDARKAAAPVKELTSLGKTLQKIMLDPERRNAMSLKMKARNASDDYQTKVAKARALRTASMTPDQAAVYLKACEKRRLSTQRWRQQKSILTGQA
tara:strand:- start:256 stop:876 length:621 start_codon:yes stop_codon:yes gene_type:complete